jgi:4-amino-4-deoxy-L-arabinose transferase-like glycosyltransferase
MAELLRTAFGRRALLILAGALLLRIVIVLTTDHHLGADATQYDRYARSIAAADGYPPSNIALTGPTAFFPPLFPGIIGAIYWLTGDSLGAALLVQCLIGTAVVALIGLVCNQLWGGRVALVAMALAAIFPPFLVSVTTLLPEPLFIVLELAAVAAILEHRTSEHAYRWAVAAGIFVGLATLTRANGIVLIPPLLIGAIKARPLRSLPAVTQAMSLILAAVLVVSPWSIRNSLAFDRFLPLTTQANLALARNYNPGAESRPGHPSTPFTSEQLSNLVKRPGLDEAEIAEKAGSIGRDFAGDHPGYVIETLLRNTARTLGFMDGVELARASPTAAGANRELAAVGAYSFYFVAALALLGAFAPTTRRTPWWFWATPVLLWLSVAWLSAGRVKYRLPVDPFILMLASIAAVEIWERLRARLSPSIAGQPTAARSA